MHISQEAHCSCEHVDTPSRKRIVLLHHYWIYRYAGTLICTASGLQYPPLVGECWFHKTHTGCHIFRISYFWICTFHLLVTIVVLSVVHIPAHFHSHSPHPLRVFIATLQLPKIRNDQLTRSFPPSPLRARDRLPLSHASSVCGMVLHKQTVGKLLNGQQRFSVTVFPFCRSNG